ncbi:MAG: ABC transporter permease [Planctomycetota bacterium]|jgi:ribose transport system permease protein|nr:ABC transporter permease [Planctomycetia bacterium]MDO7678736.1 ABC transporter permease [Pirellulales bacterium]RLS32666.1 MAG: ABC transporter permease [Planctomycetota bacterium]TSA04514.1 MAG: ABC transporter permease [Planctomycetaceae bacterium]
MKILKDHGDTVGILAVWILLVLLFGVLSDHFLSANTLTTLAGRIPALTVIAAGMTLVLIVGGIDLSVGSVLGLSSAVLGLLMVDWKVPLVISAPIAIVVGMLAGTVNGLFTVGLRIPSFLVTLGMLEICRGAAYLVTRSQTKYIGASVEPLASMLPGTTFPISFFLSVGVVVGLQVLLEKTILGRHIVAIGTNEHAVRLAGIDPRPAKILVFLVCGTCAGVGSLFHCARLGSADPNAGSGMELAAIAAVVIGGTSLLGGRGSVIKTFIGVLIVATLEAGLAQIGASEPLKRVVTGAVIIAAVSVDVFRRRCIGENV